MNFRSANDRPRDEYGRFESESGQHNGRSQDSQSMHMRGSGGNGQRGQHAGKGPKGYQRSDERMQEDVSEALSQDSELDAGEIEVKVHNGVVTLSGTVTERQYKRMAEDLAERCSGVQDVRNEIRMARSSDGSSSSSSSSSTTEKSRAASAGGKNS